MKKITIDMKARLSPRNRNKIDTLGSSKEERSIAINQTLDIMETMRLEPHTSLILWQFKNGGNNADCQIDSIPDFALTFLDKARQQGLREEINELLKRENNTPYNNSLLNCISKRRDYLPQYPSARRENEGVSHKFFYLYQTYIRGYPVESLHTAYKIAQYIINSKLDYNSNRKHKNFGVDINSDLSQRTKARGWIVDMAKEGRITFEEYYDQFIADQNPWSLIKYYLLKPEVTEFKHSSHFYTKSNEHKDAVIEIGTRLFNSLMGRKTEERFKKEILGGFEANKIGESWLRRQFELMTEEGEFDYNDNWNRLCGEINDKSPLSIEALIYF